LFKKAMAGTELLSPGGNERKDACTAVDIK
jgi:hypothetical protein